MRTELRAHVRSASISPDLTLLIGLMSFEASKIASCVIARRVRRAAERTSCSISAPVQPSLRSAIRSACPSGSQPYFRRWTAAISMRSPGTGRSTKKRSSNRPARVNSGGSAE